VAQPKQFPDLTERESQRLHAADKTKGVNITIAISAKATLCS
jgi:hypothetical protein